jgi:hypothetical protein
MKKIRIWQIVAYNGTGCIGRISCNIETIRNKLNDFRRLYISEFAEKNKLHVSKVHVYFYYDE